MIHARTLGITLTCSVAWACGQASDPAPAPPDAERTTLANGAVSMSYTTLPPSAEHVLVTDVQLGAVDGDANLSFGDIRSIEAASDGTIFVLDYQASEIRTFDASGIFLGTIASKGEGPSELTSANGMILVGDSLLWVQDHGKRSLLALERDGTEVLRLPMHLMNYGYVWNGTVDDASRFWKPTNVMAEGPDYRPPEGLSRTTSQSLMVSYDPHTEAIDSVPLGPRIYRQFVLRRGTGSMHLGIPFDPQEVTVIDPTGGFWRTNGADYRVVRLSPAGDTTLVITADVPATPVTNADREQWITQMTDFDETLLATAEEVAALAPQTKPQITGLVLDERGNVWVRRGGPKAPVRYDIFTKEGAYVTSVSIDFPVSEYLPPRIRNGKLYALTTDDLDVQYVTRAVLPTVLTR